MTLALAMVVGGLLALFAGATALIKGAAGLARRWGMSPLVVGRTVVAGGTSSPELFVVTGAALAGRDGIALGNVLGANSLHIGLILGLTAMGRPVPAQPQTRRICVGQRARREQPQHRPHPRPDGDGTAAAGAPAAHPVRCPDHDPRHA